MDEPRVEVRRADRGELLDAFTLDGGDEATEDGGRVERAVSGE